MRLLESKLYGITHTSTYIVWSNMLKRCHDTTNKDYQWYGARGITVCDRWRESFVNFITDMGEAPSGLVLERKDNNASYCKDNCAWVTRSQNCRNRRSNHLIEFKGVTKTLTAWAEEYKMDSSTLRKRLKLGWTVDKALTKKRQFRW